MLKNLKSLRDEKGLSQQNLAEVLDVSQQAVNKYENQNIEPNIDSLKKLADYFETSIDYLVGYTEIRHKIEPVSPYELNENEAALVNKYRKLTTKFRKSIMTLIDDLLTKSDDH